MLRKIKKKTKRKNRNYVRKSKKYQKKGGTNSNNLELIYERGSRGSAVRPRYLQLETYYYFQVHGVKDIFLGKIIGLKNKGNAPYPDIIIEHRYNHYKKKTETIFPGVIIEKIYVAIPSIPPPSYNNVLRENNIKAAIKNNSVVKPMKETYKQQMSRLKNEWNREVQARRASKRNSNNNIKNQSSGNLLQVNQSN